MQLIADLIEAISRWSADFISTWWPSLLLLAVAVPLLRNRKFRLPAPRPWVAYTLIALIALAAAALRTMSFGEPHPPWFMDDFGYLIEADTFFHGRLANPMHPMHRYFETFFILQTPSYSAIYPPGLPLLLALGRLLFGRPIFGLWIGCAAAAVALSWAVAAVASREVVWVIGLFCAIHPMIVQSPATMHSLAPGVIAGALTIGATLRLPRTSAAITMGIGLGLLANTRPYEGLYIAAAAFAFALSSGGEAPCLSDSRSTADWRGRLSSTGIAIATALMFLPFTFLHNRAVTGNGLQFAYTTYIERYASAPNLLWEKPFPPHPSPTPEMERTYRIFRNYYERSRRPDDFITTARIRIEQMIADSLGFGVGWVDSLRLFFALPFFFGLRQKKIVAAILLFIVAIVQITWWPQPHYLAPAAGLVAILYAGGMQRMIDRGQSALAYACVFTAIGSALVIYHASMGQVPLSDPNRMRTTEILDGHRGPQLVIADDRCSAVVFNGAEIDAQHTVWAHDAPGGIGALLDYYRDRDVWRLECHPFSLQHIRSPLAPPRRASYERDIFYPYRFPGRLRQSE
jgi:hypothetical protein